MGLEFSLGAELDPLVPEEPPVFPNVPRPGVNLQKAQTGNKSKLLQNKRPDWW